MMEEKATIVAMNKDTITLASDVKSSCSSCAQSTTCSSGQVAKAFPHRTLEFSIPFSHTKHAHLTLGDQVTVALPEIDVLKSAWQVYLYPIIGLISFSLVSQLLQNTGVLNDILNGLLNHELFALLVGITGGYLGFRLARYLQNNNNLKLKLCPKIISTVSV